MLIDISYIPETMPANKLLKKFIQEHKSVAVVVDEFGGISGMITIEDIMEEIFGEIDDEHDVDEFIEKNPEKGQYIFSGRLKLDYLNEKYRLNLPESEEYDTLPVISFSNIKIYLSSMIRSLRTNTNSGF